MDINVSLITVTYNSGNALRTFWRDYSPHWAEWIVADNASQDDSREVARSLGATVLELKENRGFSAANNTAAERAKGEVLIFCNPDVEIEPEGIRRLAELAVAKDCLVAPQLVNSDGSLQENGRGAPFPHRKLRHMLQGRDTQKDVYSRIAEPDELLPVVWVMGAVVAMSRETFDRIGGWDPGFFIYYEDAEICIRALREGVPTFVDGSVRWRHGWARETARGFSPSAWKHEIRSAFRFYASTPYSLLPLGRRGRELMAADRRGLKR